MERKDKTQPSEPEKPENFAQRQRNIKAYCANAVQAGLRLGWKECENSEAKHSFSTSKLSFHAT
jgi:hypothetical protein